MGWLSFKKPAPLTLYLIVIALLSAADFTALLCQYRLYDSLYTYRWKPPASILWHTVILLAFTGLVGTALHRRITPRQFLLTAIVAGLLLQFGFALIEGKGIEALRTLTVTSGHSEFAHKAVQFKNIPFVMNNYERLATKGKLGFYLNTKPPGQLLFYVVTERLSTWWHGGKRRLVHLYDTITFCWPFIATLAVLPLYTLAAGLASDRVARIAATLYLLTPAFDLIKLHADQVLFPLLFLGCLVAFWRCLQYTKRDTSMLLAGIGTGVATGLATFFQFPIALALVFGAGLAFAQFYTSPQRSNLVRLCSLAIAIVAGIGLTLVFFKLSIGYDPLTRWKKALAYHAQFRHVTEVTAQQMIDNVLEFIEWLGVPIAFLCLSLFFTRDARRAPAMPALGVCLIGIIFYLAGYAYTIAEVARLWIFLMPIACILAAHVLHTLTQGKNGAIAFICTLQLITIYLIKLTHDFY